MERIYLDHAAATPVSDNVMNAMAPFWSMVYGNPSSIHQEGIAASHALSNARELIARELGVLQDEVIFTGSATESCNLALVGAVTAWEKDHPGETPHIIVSAIEHDAVLLTARTLEARGVRVTLLSVDEDGIVNLEELARSISKETVLISIMYVNNEIGVIQPLRDVSRLVRAWKKDVRGVTRDVRAQGDGLYPLLHSDVCQATNYLELNIPQLGLDLMTFNASKIYGPKGVGALVVRRGINMTSQIVGGGHEGGLRAGTENLPLIVGFAEAFRDAAATRVIESERLIQLRDWLIAELQKIDGVQINGSLADRIPNNVHFTIPHADHEFLAIALDARGFAVSTKSACNESEAEYSHVLIALGRQKEDGRSSGIRITMGRNTTREGLEAFVATLIEVKRDLILINE